MPPATTNVHGHDLLGFLDLSIFSSPPPSGKTCSKSLNMEFRDGVGVYFTLRLKVLRHIAYLIDNC